MVRRLCLSMWLVTVACGDNLPVDEEQSTDLTIEAPAMVRVIEGETGSFLLNVSGELGHPVSVEIRSRDEEVASITTRWIILTSENAMESVPVELFGVEDDGDLINDQTDVDILVDGVVVRSVAATIVDNDLQQIVADTTSVTINEGYTGTFTVRLVREPSSAVTLMVRSSEPTVAHGSPAMLTFTRQNYAVPQQVTIWAERDNDTVDATAIISVGDLPGVESPRVTATIRDLDLQRLILNATNLGIFEGDTAVFSVALAHDPLGPVSVNVTSSDPTKLVIASSSVLTFDSSNYTTPKAVTLDAYEDVDTADENVSITLTGPPSDVVHAVVVDKDQIIVPSQLTVDEGGTATLTVKLANDPGSGGRVVDVQVISGDASIANGTLDFYSSTYASGLSVSVTGLVDPYSTQSKSAVLRVSSPGQVSRDVQVTVVQRIPGHLSGFMNEHWDSGAGAVGELQLSLNLATPWPGDGVLEVSLPPVYDLTGVTIASTSVDGTLSLTTTGSTLVITRANGTPSGSSVTITFANWRNPSFSGDYWIPVATRTASSVPIDTGTVRDSIGTAYVVGGTVSLASHQVAAATNVTFTFTTKNPWPADGRVTFYMPLGFDMSNATIVATSGFDGQLTLSSVLGPSTFVRSGATSVPAGTTISITLGNVVNPPSDRETSWFSIQTGAPQGGIDRADIGGVIIGCPPIRRSPVRVASIPFGARPWNWTPGIRLQWGYPATATLVGETELLVLDDFEFNLPQNATITGIELEIRHDVQTDQLVDSAIRIVKRGVISTADRSSIAPWAMWTAVTYGGVSDLWSETWTPSDILSSTFGVAIAARSITPEVTATAGVGLVQLTVYSTCQ